MNDQPKTPVIPLRQDVPDELKWDLTPLYADSAAWEADFARLDEHLAPLLAWQGRLNSQQAVAQLFDAETKLDRLLERLLTYARLRHDEDTTEAAAQAREARIRARYAQIAAQCAWITPELLARPEEELRHWMEAPGLREARRTLEKILRRKPHVLSTPEETLLARTTEILSAPEQIYQLLANADLTFPDIPGPHGEPWPLTEGTYRLYLERPERSVRKAAFETLLGGYERCQHTLAATLATQIKAGVLVAQTRHFSSARAAALFEDQVPESFYDALIAVTRTALPLYQRYLRLRRQVLGLDDLDMYDLYVPLLPSCAEPVPRQQAAEWLREAARPLGDEYLQILETALSARWIDWLENRGKRSGAYSSGCYDSPPYLLLNYHERLDDAFTLAHELGHSLHTALSNRSQPYRTAHYPIFLAEIASTVNELLLTYYLLDQPAGATFRAHLLNHLCDSFKGTVFRQVMFAEFERDLYRWEEEGTPLTADFLREQYAGLNRLYHADLPNPHPAIAMEWARIPHFYYQFYVYKYATSLCAALIFARRLREGYGREEYLGLLKSGDSRDPLAAVTAAGVDLADPTVLQQAFDEFAAVLSSLEAAVRPEAS